MNNVQLDSKYLNTIGKTIRDTQQPNTERLFVKLEHVSTTEKVAITTYTIKIEFLKIYNYLNLNYQFHHTMKLKEHSHTNFKSFSWNHFLFYIKYQELNKQTTDAIQSIPINAALIIESENWSSTLNELENTMLWKTISNSED